MFGMEGNVNYAILVETFRGSRADSKVRKDIRSGLPWGSR